MYLDINVATTLKGINCKEPTVTNSQILMWPFVIFKQNSLFFTSIKTIKSLTITAVIDLNIKLSISKGSVAWMETVDRLDYDPSAISWTTLYYMVWNEWKNNCKLQ